MPSLPAACRSALRVLAERAGEVWERYQQEGPGRLPAELFGPVDEAVRQWDAAVRQTREEQMPGSDVAALNEAVEAVRTLHDLAQRCCCRSEGLCFITGEAGLIPRRDLHRQYEEALDTVRRLSV